MVVVVGHYIQIRAVATEADQVGVLGKLQRVGVVAIAADDARGVHPTLEERTPDVDLFENLTVRVIE
jgi:hypothetical protein